MKKLFATILVLGALISGNKIYASGSMKHPIVNPAKSTQVSFDNVNIGARLYVKDSNGLIIYSERVRTEGTYRKGFDFSALPENEYYFELDKRGFITIYPFTVEDEFVQLHRDDMTEIVKPLILVENNKVKLMRNIDQEQALKVKIFYEGQELVFDETIEKDGMIGKVYDFSSSTSGDYLFTVEYDNRSFSQYVSIKTFI